MQRASAVVWRGMLTHQIEDARVGKPAWCYVGMDRLGSTNLTAAFRRSLSGMHAHLDVIDEADAPIAIRDALGARDADPSSIIAQLPAEGTRGSIASILVTLAPETGAISEITMITRPESPISSRHYGTAPDAPAGREFNITLRPDEYVRSVRHTIRARKGKAKPGAGTAGAELGLNWH